MSVGILKIGVGPCSCGCNTIDATVGDDPNAVLATISPKLFADPEVQKAFLDMLKKAGAFMVKDAGLTSTGEPVVARPGDPAFEEAQRRALEEAKKRAFQEAFKHSAGFGR